MTDAVETTLEATTATVETVANVSRAFSPVIATALIGATVITIGVGAWFGHRRLKKQPVAADAASEEKPAPDARATPAAAAA